MIETAVKSFLEEVPALEPMKIVVGVDLHARGDTQQFRIEMPGPVVTRDIGTDARIRIDMRRDFFNAMVENGAKVADWREAIDFLRYYAAEARRLLAEPTPLPGPTGEENRLELHPRGVFVCISPWNFPLAIFTGQLAAALAAGNAVVAKPAEATSLTAAAVVDLLHRAGVPGDALVLLPGEGGTVGRSLSAEPMRVPATWAIGTRSVPASSIVMA